MAKKKTIGSTTHPRRATQTRAQRTTEAPAQQPTDHVERIVSGSEWERLAKAAEPLLRGRSPDTLTDEDIARLVKVTRVDRDDVRLWIAAYRAAVAHALEGEKERVAPVDWQAHYAWLRSGLPSRIDDLLAQPTEALTGRLVGGVSTGVVPAELASSIDRLATGLDRVRIDRTLERPAANGRPSLNALLDTVAPTWLNRETRRRVAVLVSNVAPDSPQFHEEAAKAGLTADQAVVLQRTLRLADIADGHVRMIQAMQPLVAHDRDASLGGLLSLDAERWLDLAYDRGAPAGIGSTPERFARRMSDHIERTAPTTTLRARIEAGAIDTTQPGFNGVRRFLANNPHFDIATSDVDDFVAAANLAGIDAERPALSSALRQLQAMKRLMVRWEDAQPFIDAGLASTEAIAEHGPNGLKARLGGQVPSDTLDDVAFNAKAMKVAGLGLVSHLMPFLKPLDTQVMASKKLDGAVRQTVDNSPSLRRLFGALERCACDPCQSVLSPAAYFVDLMRFVCRDNGMAWHLQQHRGDLFDLELSCDNSNIELQHIDLVNEILENAVALPYEVSMPGVANVVAALQQRPLPAAVVAALQATTWDPVVEADLVVEVHTVQRMNTTYAIISDRYRRWSLEIRDGYFGTNHGTVGLELSNATSAAAAAALDEGRVLHEAAPAMSRYLVERGLGVRRAPMEATEIGVHTIEPGRRWRLTFTAVGRVSVDEGTSTLRLSANDAAGEAMSYSAGTIAATRAALENGSLGGVFAAKVSDPATFQATLERPGRWRYQKGGSVGFFYVPAAVVITSLTYQATASDRDVIARPQHRNPRAYREFLAKPETVFPWALPFDVTLAEVRALAATARTPRADLTRMALPFDDEARRVALAIESLGFMPAEWTIASTVATGADVWKRWGLNVVAGSASLFDTFDDQEKSAAPLELLSIVSLVTQQARLTVAELEALLECEFINPGRAVAINTVEDAGPTDQCDPTKLELTGHSAAFLDRLHRFVRIQRRLKWPVRDVDVTLRALYLQPGATADSVVQALADLERLRARLDLPVELLVTGFYGFDRVVYNAKPGNARTAIQPLYERTFQDARMLVQGGAPGAPTPRVSDPTLAYSAVLNPASTTTIGDKLSAIAAAAGLRAGDVLPLLAMEGDLATPPVAVDANTRLTATHLQVLMRSPALARALHVPVARLTSLIDLLQSRPFVTPRGLIDFLDDVQAVVKSGLDVDELRYVLTHHGPESGRWVLQADRVKQVLDSLQVALRGAAAQVVVGNQPEAITQAQVATLIDPATSAADRIALLRQLTQLTAFQLQRVIASLWPNLADPFTAEARVRELVDVALQWRRRAALIVPHLAQAFGIAAPLVDDLLWLHLSPDNTPGRVAIELFADPRPRTPDQRFESTQTVFDVATVAQRPEYAVLMKLHKIGRLDQVWHLTRADLARFATIPARSAALTGLKLDAVPVTSARGLSSDWKRSTVLLGIARGAAGMAAAVDDYTRAIMAPGADPVAAGAAVLSVAFDLPAADVRELVGADLLDFAAAPGAQTQARDPLRIQRWLDLLTLVRRSGLSVADLKALTKRTPDRGSVDAALRALRTKFGDPGWHEALASATNTLRAEQRDRLVDYLMWRDRLRTADDLYARYLIDVQMAPCMRTTRLLQATAAVQLFVHRCLMNLEPDLPPVLVDPDDEWQFKKNYRVWEANRRVLLHPEEWLYPELRDDKSEIFRSFDSALMQAEASDANAEAAVRGYLEALVEVGQISVMGMYEDAVAATPYRAGRPHRTLHVIGRSPDPPYTYFVRMNVQNGEPGNRWTPWERINLDLPSCHVVLFVLGGELYLVWPIVQLERDTNNADYYTIRLAWSRRTSLGWSQRKLAEDMTTRIGKHVNLDEKSSLALKVLEPSTSPRRASVELYVARKTPSEFTLESISPVNTIDPVSEDWPTKLHIDSFSFTLIARGYIRYVDTGRIVHVDGAKFRIVGLEMRANPTYNNTYEPGPWTGDPANIVRTEFFDVDGNEVGLEVSTEAMTIYYEAQVDVDGNGTVVWATTPPVDIDPPVNRKSHVTTDVRFLFDVAKDPDFDDPGDNPRARVKMDLAGRFWFEIGRDTSWEPARAPIPLQMPNEVMSWESRFLEREALRADHASGLRALSGTQVFERSGIGADFLTLSAPHPTSQIADTWYWEENLSGGTSRFFELLNAPNATTLVTVQPSGYEEASEYLARFADGRASLFSPDMQSGPANARFNVDTIPTYFPGGMPQGVDPRQLPLLQFDLGMPYGSYNWEVFYHLPMAVARFLASHQRFEEAQRWIEHVFNPTTNDWSGGRERYWRCLPLRHSNIPLTIEQLMVALADPNADPALKHSVQDQIAAWAASPFSPFAVARARTSAFEWYAVVAYVTNLIEWGDSLFRRDTRESINEATLKYVTASNILGRRPETVRPRGFQTMPLSFRALAGRWDDFSNAWVRLIDTPVGQLLLQWLLAMQKIGGINPHAFDKQIEQLVSIGALYFCIPANDRLLDLWDEVEDRLFKIRHCQNIDGVTRQLALLDPPIDPELLIRARLAGIDIDDVLGDLLAPPPNHRFTVLVQKATEFCTELRSMGSALLSAIERKDNELLAQLRAGQEVEMLGRAEAVRVDQVQEADANISALEQSRSNAINRYRYFQRMLGNTDIRFDAAGVPIQDQRGSLQVTNSGPSGFQGLALIPAEVDQIRKMQEMHQAAVIGGAFKLAASAARLSSSFLSAYPVTQGAGTALYAVGQGLSDLGDLGDLLALDADHSSRRVALLAAYQRRREEWIQQSTAAVDDVLLIDRQLAAARIRRTLAQHEFDNHRRAREHANELNDFVRQGKFSTAELYAWMEGQLNVVHFAAYQLAFDLAKRAERAYRREIGDTDTKWIRFAYWNASRRGLQAGEQLQVDINRMQAAYLDRRREHELTKHVSLLSLDPTALINLRQNGSCEFSIPEALYDIDLPGHYFRRLKSVSVSIPCVTGPYGGVYATLALRKSSIRVSTQPDAGYARDDSAGPDRRFEDGFRVIESIVTSSGQNDAGLFDVNLRDERFLPFEGAGAISTWGLELPEDFHSFDYSTIADVILHVRYTTRYGGDTLKTNVRNALKATVNAIARSSDEQGLVRMFSLKQEFPTEWSRLTASVPASGDRVQTFALSKSRFPYLFTNRGVTNVITNVDLFAVSKTDEDDPEFPAGIAVTQPDGVELEDWTDNTSIAGLAGQSAEADVVVSVNDDDALWTLTIDEDDVAAFREGVADLLMACSYKVS